MATTTRYPGHAPSFQSRARPDTAATPRWRQARSRWGSSSGGPPNTSTSSSSASPACWSFRACSSRSSRRSRARSGPSSSSASPSSRGPSAPRCPWPSSAAGRATKLTAALFLLGTATVGMAFLPGYDVIGMHAITLLAVFRCLQGLALGGSWDGLPSLLALNAPPQRRGWYAMLGQLGAPIGFMVASALFLFLHLTLTQADFLEWGWRYPFFVAFAINVVALFARLRLVVTEEYAAARRGRTRTHRHRRDRARPGLQPVPGRLRGPGQLRAVSSGDGVPAVVDRGQRHAADIRCADRADRGRGRGHSGHDGLRLDRRPHRPAHHAGPVRRGHRRVRAGFALAAGRRSEVAGRLHPDRFRAAGPVLWAASGRSRRTSRAASATPARR